MVERGSHVTVAEPFSGAVAHFATVAGAMHAPLTQDCPEVHATPQQLAHVFEPSQPSLSLLPLQSA